MTISWAIFPGLPWIESSCPRSWRVLPIPQGKSSPNVVLGRRMASTSTWRPRCARVAPMACGCRMSGACPQAAMPMPSIGDHTSDVGVEERRVFLVPRPEVEDPAATPLVAAARAEDLAARKPADKDESIRCRNVEMFAIHLFVLDQERLAQPLGDGMRRIHDPDAFVFPGFAPLEIAGRAHEPLENPRKVTRMQDDQPHPFEDAPLDAVDDCIGHLSVSDVTPPCQHVRRGEDRVGQPVLRLVERCGSHLEATLAQAVRDGRVDPIRVDGADWFVGSLLAILVSRR